MKRFALAAGSLTLFACGVSAQAPPPVDRMSQMQTIAASLGVKCEYCHSAPRGSGQGEPKKDIARAMMAMTDDLNAKVAVATGKPPGESTRVACITCHRGVPIPKQLTDIALQDVVTKGGDFAVTHYKELHDRYFGHQAYDFSEDTLISVGQTLSQSRPDEALAMLRLNLEYYPKSAKTYSAISFAYTRKLDDAEAIANLQKALEIDPDNGILQGRLEQLKSYHRH